MRLCRFRLQTIDNFNQNCTSHVAIFGFLLAAGSLHCKYLQVNYDKVNFGGVNFSCHTDFSFEI